MLFPLCLDPDPCPHLTLLEFHLGVCNLKEEPQHHHKEEEAKQLDPLGARRGRVPLFFWEVLPFSSPSWWCHPLLFQSGVAFVVTLFFPLPFWTVLLSFRERRKRPSNATRKGRGGKSTTTQKGRRKQHHPRREATPHPSWMEKAARPIKEMAESSTPKRATTLLCTNLCYSTSLNLNLPSSLLLLLFFHILKISPFFFLAILAQAHSLSFRLVLSSCNFDGSGPLLGFYSQDKGVHWRCVNHGLHRLPWTDMSGLGV